MQPPLRLTYGGHSTTLIELDGVRLLTDPVLRDRVAHLRRHARPVDPAHYRRVDAVLISHLHLDHLDFPSLRRLGRDTPLVVPTGAGSALSRRGFRDVVELGAGDSLALGPLTIEATRAEHSGFRPPFGPTADCLGFVVRGSRRVYFAGDTDLFPEMAALAPGLDVALLPVWGWGPNLGEGHMDPLRAAQALRLLRPRVAVPIHWGTFHPIGTVARRARFLVDPPRAFARHAEALAPEVVVRIVPPGESLHPVAA